MTKTTANLKGGNLPCTSIKTQIGVMNSKLRFSIYFKRVKGRVLASHWYQKLVQHMQGR